MAGPGTGGANADQMMPGPGAQARPPARLGAAQGAERVPGGREAEQVLAYQAGSDPGAARGYRQHVEYMAA